MEEKSKHELQVCFSDGILYSVGLEDDIERVIAKLRKHSYVRRPSFYMRLSAAQLPEIISILGDVIPWAPFVLAANYFLKGFFNEMGSESGKKIISLLRKKEVEPLSDLMSAIDETAEIAQGRLQVVIGIDIPDDHFGTAIHFEHGDPQSAIMMALFIDNLEKIKEAMVLEMEKGNVPLGGASISVQQDRDMKITWKRRSDGLKTEITIETEKY